MKENAPDKILMTDEWIRQFDDKDFIGEDSIEYTRTDALKQVWKPSDEQMNTLEYYMHSLVCNEHKEILFGLYTDLKKIRDEQL